MLFKYILNRIIVSGNRVLKGSLDDHLPVSIVVSDSRLALSKVIVFSLK